MEYGPVKIVGKKHPPPTPEESLRQAARLRRLWKKACAAQGLSRPREILGGGE